MSTTLPAAQLSEGSSDLNGPPARGSLIVLPAALVGAAAWGVVARLWMRWISTEPDFSWSGTLAIVIAFTLFGTMAGVVTVIRRRSGRRWLVTVARVVGVIFTLPLFVGAGALMMPTVIGGGLALWRADWRGWIRIVFAVMALVPVGGTAVMIASDFGVVDSTLRSIGLIAIYGVVVVATKPNFCRLNDGWRMPRWLRIACIVVAIAPALFLTVGLAGVRG
jgi:hypothetical protein